MDPTLDDTYALLARDCDFGMKVAIGEQQFDWKQNPFLPSVRQIGHEMLRTLSGMDVLRQKDVPKPETEGGGGT